MKFTAEQLDDWRRYEEVRKRGKYNMYDPHARLLSGLDPERYLFVMKHFSALKEAVLGPAPEQPLGYMQGKGAA